MSYDVRRRARALAREMKPEFLGKDRPATLLHRFSSPEEVTNLCAYVASPPAGAAPRVECGLVEGIG